MHLCEGHGGTVPVFVRTKQQTALGVICSVSLEALYAFAERSYLRARETGLRDDWVTCVAHCRAYVALGGYRNVHPYYNFALNAIGRVEEALESCRAGLVLDPVNADLLGNRALYESHLRMTFGDGRN